MSELTDKLEYILDWLKSKGLESFDCYNPGLTQSEIDAILKDFPFNLSKELYELYQWRNGSPDLIQSNSCYGNEFLFPEQFYSYEPLYFCSLKDSIYMYKILWENGQLTQSMNEDLLTENYLDYDDSYWKKNWFPIGAFEFRRILYVVGGIDPSPVFLWDVDCIPVQVRIYKDIKSMISVIAECCNLDIYKLVSEKNLKKIRIDEEKLDQEKAIFQKYNS